MDRATAVRRINLGLGFRPDGWSGEANVILLLQEAQRDLQKGKTLPKFLLQEDQTLSLLLGTHSVLYPIGFLRESDETRIRFFPVGSSLPTFLERKLYIDAVEANIRETTQTVAPSVYVMRHGFIDFVTTADKNYTLYWDYYKVAAPLTSNIENEWLADDVAAQWLIGEAGFRMARITRDQAAQTDFDAMRTAGRAACFGEILASEEASGPFVMGANL